MILQFLFWNVLTLTRGRVVFFAPVLAVFLAACGGEQQTVEQAPEEETVVAVGAGDLSLNREWVRATLEQNKDKLSKMREGLASLRREIVRAREVGGTASLDSLKGQVSDLLDAHSADLEDIQASIAEMRSILDDSQRSATNQP